MKDSLSGRRTGAVSQIVKDTVIVMKSTSACLTIVLLSTIALSGCNQAAQRVASVTSSLPVPGKQDQDFDTRLSIARNYEREGKQRTARRAYRRLLKEDPANATLHHRLGVIAACDEDFEEANANFKQALELAPQNAEIVSDWGYCLFLQGEFEESIELARRGSELAPQDPRIANNLSLVMSAAPMHASAYGAVVPASNPVVQFQPVDQNDVVAVPIDQSDEVKPIGFNDPALQGAAGAEQASGVNLLNLPVPSPIEPIEPASATQESDADAGEPVAIGPAVPGTNSSQIESSGIGLENVKKLLTRARLELAAGDVQMSHAFAEAAAEIPIPLQIFQERPEAVLDEIEFVTNHNIVLANNSEELTTAAFTQAVPPAPAPFVGDVSESGDTSESDDATATEIEDPQGFRAIGRKSLSILPELGTGEGTRMVLPERRAYRRLSQIPVVQHAVGYNRDWTPMTYSWEAPKLKYNPLYFEDAQLERYGNEVCILQPFLSGARFYATLPALPYKMLSEGNSVCHTVYDLGHDRPGDCVPSALEVPPFSWTGALSTGGWAYALIVILP